MTKITMNPVRFFDMADIYTFEVDNRPLYDLSSNIDLLNNAIASAGFYHELYANPETEPAGGFSKLTCVFIGQNNRLYPIDISQPVTTIDYTKYPIYLIIESLGSSLYKCLAFSSSLTLSSLFNKFLPDSVGKAVKVGPGGSLVDELYFDLYYSDYSYQNLIVGKILTPTTISFGGNQVSVLGDNRFLPKNLDDTTTGLITRLIQNDVNSTAFKSSLINNTVSSYPFTEYVNNIYASLGTSPSKVPVYFSSVPLTTNNGLFTTSLLETVLNEVHFASPAVSTDTYTDDKYKTTGINVKALLDFSQNYLLHSKSLSYNLGEISQTLSTSLVFDSDTTPGLLVSFPSSLAPFGTTGGSSILTGALAANNITGIQLGSSDAKASIYSVTNTTESSSTFTEDTNSYPIASLVGSTALMLKVTGTNALLGISSEGPIIFNTSAGLFSSNVPQLGYELANKLYVDTVMSSAANAAQSKIPLAGSTEDIPVTGSLYFDIKSNVDSSTVLKFDTLLSAQIQSAYPIEIKTLATSDYQVIRADTPASGDAKDLTNRAFVTTAINNAIGDSIGTDYVSRTIADSISASKTFTAAAQIITNHLTPLVLNPPSGHTEVNIQSSAETINFISGSSAEVKLTSSDTSADDVDATLTTKGFVIQEINDITDSKIGEMVYGIWFSTAKATKTALDGFTDWYYATRGVLPNQHSNTFSTYFNLVEDGALRYASDTPGLFSVSVVDAAVTTSTGGSSGGIFRTQTAILVKSGGTVNIITRNMHQDDTDGDSVNTKVGTSCSSMVYLQKDDIVYLLSEHPEVVSASLARIR